MSFKKSFLKTEIVFKSPNPSILYQTIMIFNYVKSLSTLHSAQHVAVNAIQ